MKTSIRCLLPQWWKKRKTIKAGGETHNLYFSGGEETTNLVLESTPRKIEAYVAEARKTRTSEKEKAALDKIEAQSSVVKEARAELRKLKKSNAAETEMQPHAAKLDAAFEIIGTHVAFFSLIPSLAPNKCPWISNGQKPAWDEYKPLFLYRGPSETESSWQLTANPKNQRFVKKYNPTASHESGGIEPNRPSQRTRSTWDQTGVSRRSKFHSWSAHRKLNPWRRDNQ